jgi:hypothetical protein
MTKSFSCSPLIFLVRSDGRGAPAEADIRVMALGFSQITHVSNKVERFLKIAKAEGSFDTVAVIAQFPMRSLRLKALASSCVSGGMPPRQGVHFLSARVSIMSWPSDDSLEAKDGSDLCQL